MVRFLRVLFFILVSMAFCVDAYPQYTYKGGRDANTGLTRVGKNGKYGYIDDSGREIVSIVYDELGDFGDGNRPALAKLYGKYGFVGTNGEIIAKFQYEAAFPFEWNNNCAPVKRNGKYGYVNTFGAEVIPLSYEFVMPFSDDLAAVKQNGKYGFINEQGNIVIHCTYDDVEYGFFAGKAWVKQGYRWGMIDKNGSVVVPFLYSSIKDFDYYTGFADVMGNDGVRYYDKEGKRYASIEDREYAQRKTDMDLATIEWLNTSNETNSPNFTVKAGIKSKSKITKISLTCSGQRGISVVPTDDYQQRLSKTVSLVEGPNKIRLSVTNVAGTQTAECIVNYTMKHLPEIEWTSSAETVSEQIYKVTAGIKSKSRLEDVYVILNDERNRSRSIKVVQSDNFDMSLNESVTLSEGVNTIKIFARNADGSITTEAKNVVYEKTSPLVLPKKRLALVMGNANYEDEANSLTNPINDASDFANKLESLGFDVIRAFDKTKQGMDIAISEFGQKAKNYEAALFFYAGHGIQSDKLNYLMPIDADPQDESQVPYKCVPADMVVETMVKSNCPMRIIILDACRNNPWERKWSRAIGNRGFTGINATGTLIAYSTGEGTTASDGFGEKHSPYMQAILETLDVPGLSLGDFFQNVTELVLTRTNNKQEPWISGSLRGKFYFNNQKNK